MPATIRDIADRLSISVSTVSYALNGGPKPVSEDLTRRVARAAIELGYRPNRLARSLITRRTHTIGVVPADVESDILLTPCIHLSLNGIFNAAARLRQDVLVFTAHDRNLPDEVAFDLLDRRVDGVVFIAPRLDSPALKTISESGLPFAVITENYVGGSSFLVDNEAGAFMAMEHLYELGHRKIAHVVGNLLKADAHLRRDAYRRFMVEAGLDIAAGFEYQGDYHRSAGFRAGLDFAQMQERPTAVFCANDDMAFGLIEALKLKGIDVPGEISVVGFDDGVLAANFHPTLTTIRQPLEEMSAEALLAVVQQIETGDAPQGKLFSPELIVRGSAAIPTHRDHPTKETFQ